MNKNVREVYRGINEFKRGYQPKSNLVKNKNGDLADSHNILNRWKLAVPGAVLICVGFVSYFYFKSYRLTVRYATGKYMKCKASGYSIFS
jgi:hypothetical protein